MTLRSALLFALLLVAAPAPAQTPLEIDLQAPGTPVSPILHGLMTEEINYSYDGGLYAELIRNRAFLDDAKNQPVHWSTIEQPGAEGKSSVVATHPLTDKLPNSLEVEVKAATAEQRFARGQRRLLGHSRSSPTRLTARRSTSRATDQQEPQDRQDGGGPLCRAVGVSLESADGAIVYARAETPAVNRHWQKFELTLTTGRGRQADDGRPVRDLRANSRASSG